MICFEIYVNGEKRCTAGVGEYGILNALAAWRGFPPAEDDQRATTAARLSVDGLAYPPDRTEPEG